RGGAEPRGAVRVGRADPLRLRRPGRAYRVLEASPGTPADGGGVPAGARDGGPLRRARPGRARISLVLRSGRALYAGQGAARATRAVQRAVAARGRGGSERMHAVRT